MTPLELLALYLAVGSGVAGLVLRRSEGQTSLRLASAFAAWLLWPLWAPIALAADRPIRVPRAPGADPVHAALDEALAAAAGSPLEPLVGSGARIRAEIDRAAGRLAQIELALSRPGFDPAQAAARVRELEARGASSRALATARLHRDGVERLARLRDADRRGLEEAIGALEALRAQILLARALGAEGSDIVSELWARVEGLGAALSVGAPDDPPMSLPEASA